MAWDGRSAVHLVRMLLVRAGLVGMLGSGCHAVASTLHVVVGQVAMQHEGGLGDAYTRTRQAAPCCARLSVSHLS
jgi:hypothetical protein